MHLFDDGGLREQVIERGSEALARQLLPTSRARVARLVELLPEVYGSLPAYANVERRLAERGVAPLAPSDLTRLVWLHRALINVLNERECAR